MFYLVVRLYLIEILHQTTTLWFPASTSVCCILSKFYIKPQHGIQCNDGGCGCILSKFYIKPQQVGIAIKISNSCILSKFYIKPQQRFEIEIPNPVVSYRNSTSNHNKVNGPLGQQGVVSYRNSTSNHNFPHCIVCKYGLYLIEILHQTTTTSFITLFDLPLYLIEILHQTTTFLLAVLPAVLLYLIEILHQTTTESHS